MKGPSVQSPSSGAITVSYASGASIKIGVVPGPAGPPGPEGPPGPGGGDGSLRTDLDKIDDLSLLFANGLI